MTRERFDDIMDQDIPWGNRIEGNTIFKGLAIVNEYVENYDIEGGHEIIYGIEIDELIEAGVTEDHVLELNKMGWFIDEDYECLAHHA